MRSNKCRKASCARVEQTAGLCKLHYAHHVRTHGIPTGFVDPQPVVEHIERLNSAGLSQARIAEMIGSNQMSVWQIASGQRQRLLAATAAKIMAIPIHDSWRQAREGAKVPATGSRRRLRALVALGYPTRQLARELGAHSKAVTQITSGAQTYTEANTARRVSDLFDRLQHTPGPSKISRGRAVKKGWDVPLSWDEDAIDYPEAEPQLPECEKDAWYEDYLELKGFGLTHDRIAERLGMQSDSLTTKVRRHLKLQGYPMAG